MTTPLPTTSAQTIATPAPSTLVLTAALGPRMPVHRLLLGVATACGVVTSETWVREARPYRSVTCAACKEAGREFRESQRGGRA